MEKKITKKTKKSKTPLVEGVEFSPSYEVDTQTDFAIWYLAELKEDILSHQNSQGNEAYKYALSYWSTPIIESMI